MDPWKIIGWTGAVAIILGAVIVLLIVVCLIGGNITETISTYRRHRATRDIDPSPGQKWIQDGEPLYISRIHDNGVIGISTAPPNYSGNRASWGDTPDAWKKRVRNRKLYLETAA